MNVYAYILSVIDRNQSLNCYAILTELAPNSLLIYTRCHCNSDVYKRKQSGAQQLSFYILLNYYIKALSQ